MKRILFLFIIIFSACTGAQQDEGGLHTETAGIIPSADSTIQVAGWEEDEDLDLRPRFEMDTSECSRLLNSFIQSSSFTWLENQPKDSIYAMVNEVDDSLVTIRLEYHNDGEHFTAGWLSLDLRSGLLKDEMSESDTVRSFTYDKKKLEALMSNCLFEDSE